MASRQDSDAGAPTRWRSTQGLADPEPEDSAPRQPPPLNAWKSTGNLHGAGTLPRPWARPRTGTNVQKLLERLQSQEDGAPRSSWADQEDDGRTSDAPRAKLRSDPKAGTEERQRPRPRPRSMGELLGLTPKSEDDEETRDEEAKRDEEATKDEEVPSTANRKNADDHQRKPSGVGGGRDSEKGISVEEPSEAPKSVRNATRLFEALESQARAPGLRASRARNENPPVRRPVSMAFGATSADSYASDRRDDMPALSKTHSDAQHEESPPNVAVRTHGRHHRARHGVEDTDDKQALHPSELHAETLASAARYRDQTHSTGRLSATEAAIVSDIKKAAKAASGKTELEEVETPVSSVTPENRYSVTDEKSTVNENGQTVAPRNGQTPAEESPKARSSDSSPTSSSLASPVDNSPSSGSISSRRVHVKPTDESDSGERSTEEKEGKVKVKVLSVEFKTGKGPVQSTAVEAEIEVVNDQKTENAEVHAVAEHRSETRAGRENRKNKKETSDADQAEEPKYKPVAAPRRLTASGMSLDDQVVVSPQTPTRAMELTAVSDDYKKMRPRGSGRLGHNKEARTKVIPMNERGSGLRARGEVQDFEKLRAECRRSGRLFEDPEFPATDCSIFFSRTPPRPFQWKRPHEICSNPKFISKGASRFDVQQGELGDCWLLAAVANITMNQELFAQIVPSDQEMDDGYAGIFHFRFWQYGRWVDVVIDDRLPTYHGQLAFMHSQDNREFWSALLEKAYAKLHGSYEALKGGTTCEAMEDFSGGVTEMYDIDKAPDNLFQVMTKAHQRQSLMSCSIEPDPYVAEAEMPNGLIKGHAYSVTKACLADIATPRVQGKIPMVRVRNPWGNEAEWKGAFSDKSPEWNYIPEETRRELGLTFDADGEFWMTFKDFTRNFQRLEICNLSPDSLEDEDQEGDASRRWEMSVFEGAWVRGATAGGCRNYINTFAHNPQYRIELQDIDEDDEEKKCTVIVAVMQKNRRAQRRLGLDCLTIGFSIYHLSDPDSAPKPLDAQFFRYNCSVARAPSFINLREVSCRFKLPPGTYCIIPSTFEPNEEGEFLIRIFSEKRNNMAENDEDVGPGQVSEEITPELSRESEYDRAVRQFFTQIAGDNLEVDWRELKEVLDYALKKEFQFDGFSKDTIRSMVALLDVDNSGQLGLEEFKSLWSSIRLWKSVFKKYDKEGTSYLSGFQLRAALNESGYRVNNNMLNLLMHRYGDREGRVAFDDFMACAVKMKTCIEIFKNKDPRQTNKATFSLEDWMEHNMYS